MTRYPSPAINTRVYRTTIGPSHQKPPQDPTTEDPDRFIQWPEIVQAWVHLGELDPSERVIIPEYRRNSAACIHTFVTYRFPPAPPHFFLLFDCTFPFLGLYSSNMVHLIPYDIDL